LIIPKIFDKIDEYSSEAVARVGNEKIAAKKAD